MGYVLREPPIYEPLDTERIKPILQANAAQLAALKPPVRNPLSILSVLSKKRQSYTLPDGQTLDPPPLSAKGSRKLVIFGDCSATDNAAFIDLCRNASLLVHECTNAWIDPAIEKGDKGRSVREADLDKSLLDRFKKNLASESNQSGQNADRTPSSFVTGEDEQEAKQKVEAKAKKRGHSTADMTGAFARELGVKRLAMNHFSAMWVAGLVLLLEMAADARFTGSRRHDLPRTHLSLLPRLQCILVRRKARHHLYRGTRSCAA